MANKSRKGKNRVKEINPISYFISAVRHDFYLTKAIAY